MIELSGFGGKEKRMSDLVRRVYDSNCNRHFLHTKLDSLARTLASLVVAASHVEVPWELRLADNGSINKTRAVVRALRGQLPIQLMVEDAPGEIKCPDAGVTNAQHYILWTDDGVIVDENWVDAYIAAFAKYPERALFGGADSHGS
jgi:hypothetical protein